MRRVVRGFLMGTIYLHIGANKTGSSAIQKYIHGHRMDLKEQGFHVVESVIDNAHYPLSHALGCGPDLQGYDPEKEISRTIEEIQNFRNQNIVISSEYFILKTNPSEIKDRLKNKKIKIIVYLRRHDLWIESLYNQAVKTAPSIKWNSGIMSYLEYTRANSLQEFSYKTLVLRWANAFGEKNIIIRPYEKESFINNSIVSDFLNTIGCSLREITGDGETVNKSIPVQYIPMLEAIKKDARINSDRKQRIIRWMMAQESKKNISLLSDDERSSIIDENINDYKYISQMFGLENEALFANFESGFGRRKIGGPNLAQATMLISDMAGCIGERR